LIPYLLAGFAIFIAASIHWVLHRSFWKASILSTVCIVAVSLLFIFVFSSNYLGLDDSATNNSIGDAVLFVARLVSLFGLLISLMVGYFLKAIKQ